MFVTTEVIIYLWSMYLSVSCSVHCVLLLPSVIRFAMILEQCNVNYAPNIQSTSNSMEIFTDVHTRVQELDTAENCREKINLNWTWDVIHNTLIVQCIIGFEYPKHAHSLSRCETRDRVDEIPDLGNIYETFIPD